MHKFEKMDKIYSRKRIRFPKLRIFFCESNDKQSKLLKFISILLIMIITFVMILKSIEPIFDELCISKAQEIATNITNKNSSNILNSMDYSDIVKLEKDENAKTSFIQNDVVKMNKIASDIAIAIQKELTSLENNNLSIPIGALTGNKYLAGVGPNIPMKLILAGNIITDLKTEFISTGINQTSHRIYLELCCNVKILTPYKTINESITNQVLLVETVIVGEVPNSYYNFNGLNNEDTLDLMR